MEEVKTPVKVECKTVIWRNKKVNALINDNFPGEWERDIAYMALAVVSVDPEIAKLLGAEVEE
jgi:hypothetical protein